MTGDGIDDRRDAVPQRLVLEQREVVRRVVGDDRDAGIQQRAERRDDLADDLGRRAPLRAGVRGGDAVDGGGALGDLDARDRRTSRARWMTRARGIQQADVRRDDAVRA